MTHISPQPVREPDVPGPAVPTRRPNVAFPAGACDCHAHIFGPQAQYPYLPGASYIAPAASTADYIRMLETIGCERAVLVQPSIYGSDNRCMIDALTSGRFAFRGVAVVEPDVTDAEIEALHEAGVRGIRINVASVTAGLRIEHAPRLAQRIKRLGWHLQFFVDVAKAPDLEASIARLEVPCVIDHFGHVHGEAGVQSGPFQTLLRFAQMDHVWFKLSGGYRISQQLPPFPELAPFAQALVRAAPDRCVWGSDWPHPLVDRMDNDGDLADALGVWVDDEALRQRVLVENPRRLYDFPVRR